MSYLRKCSKASLKMYHDSAIQQRMILYYCIIHTQYYNIFASYTLDLTPWSFYAADT
jgi:hypothetical protein